ncbi:MAG TPA: amidase [Deltaproteobacteria bacterium]|nr:amidase [Deltaproteobacteria bacterium]HPP80148.1 amidase [Deltaproteobacteria bacterium]
MGNFKEYDLYDGIGLAELVKKGLVSAAEVLEEAIERIERVNPKINAVILRMYDSARRAVSSRLPEGPFTGVPFLLKDLLTACAGVPLSMGCRAYRDYVPPVDSELMRRYRASGVVVAGKTNTPEFGLVAVTEPELFGPTRNPWDLGRTPGGSSGGSAAAVASGMVPMASGGDGGGSIRIPASHCGLFGLKPTRGRTPTGPYYGEIWQGAAVEHVITRTVRDSAAMLDAIHGADPGSPYVIPGPQRSYLEEAGSDPSRLRIAFTTRSPLGTPVDPECTNAVTDAARLLSELGHDVEEDEPDIDGHALAKSYFTMYFGEVAADIAEMEQVLARKVTHKDVEEPTWSLKLLGDAFSSGEFVLAVRRWNTFARSMAAFHQRYDLYLTPTVAAPPVRIGELKPKPAEETAMKIVNALGLGRLIRMSGIADKLAVENLSKTPFTQLANLTGQPAMSVPLYWSETGLPIGVQFVARFGDEATLFRLAGQLERARPWAEKRPAI